MQKTHAGLRPADKALHQDMPGLPWIHEPFFSLEFWDQNSPSEIQNFTPGICTPVDRFRDIASEAAILAWEKLERTSIKIRISTKSKKQNLRNVRGFRQLLSGRGVSWHPGN